MCCDDPASSCSSDVHGNALALAAVRKAIRTEKPDLVAVAGDLALNGPDPAGAIDLLREMEADGAAIAPATRTWPWPTSTTRAARSRG